MIANPIDVNVREFTVAEEISRVIVTAAPGMAVFPMTTSSDEVGTASLPYV